jgi:hypothetical protein
MSRYDRDQFFEALCRMREAYAIRADDDRRSSILIGDAVIYAEAVMQALDAEDSAAGVTSEADAATESMPSSETSG